MKRLEARSGVSSRFRSYPGGGVIWVMSAAYVRSLL